jgi:hypothetical protein
LSLVRALASECGLCPSKEELEVVAIAKIGGAVVSERGQMGTDLGHTTLCRGCRERLATRGFQVSVLPKAVMA